MTGQLRLLWRALLSPLSFEEIVYINISNFCHDVCVRGRPTDDYICRVYEHPYATPEGVLSLYSPSKSSQTMVVEITKCFCQEIFRSEGAAMTHAIGQTGPHAAEPPASLRPGGCGGLCLLPTYFHHVHEIQHTASSTAP